MAKHTYKFLNKNTKFCIFCTTKKVTIGSTISYLKNDVETTKEPKCITGSKKPKGGRNSFSSITGVLNNINKY